MWSKGPAYAAVRGQAGKPGGGTNPWTDTRATPVRAARCIRGDYTLPVASLLPADELEKLTRSMVDKMRPLPLVQREIVIRRLVDYDERARRHSPQGVTPSTTLAMVVRRDGVM